MWSGTVKTEWGFLAAAYTEKGLSMLTLPHKTKEDAIEELILITSSFLPLRELPKQVTSDLKRYFRGEKIEFNYETDLFWATPFQLKVLRTIKEIPYGEVCTYAQVAKKVGNLKAPRAVGQALHNNKLPLVFPCHRVIRKDKTLGGFRGGLELKKKLLELEGSYPFELGVGQNG